MSACGYRKKKHNKIRNIVAMNLKILVINILLFILSEVFAYQTRKCEAGHGSCQILHSNIVQFRIMFNFLYCFFFFFLFFNFGSGVGLLSELCPSSDSLTKSFNQIFRNMKEVHLGENEQSAALVQFSWNSSTFKVDFDAFYFFFERNFIIDKFCIATISFIFILFFFRFWNL